MESNEKSEKYVALMIRTMGGCYADYISEYKLLWDKYNEYIQSFDTQEREIVIQLGNEFNMLFIELRSNVKKAWNKVFSSPFPAFGGIQELNNVIEQILVEIKNAGAEKL